MTDEERRAILEEITAICQPPEPLQPYEVTTEMLMAQWDCSHQTARRRLQRAVNAGLVEMRDAVHNGHPCKAYRIVEEAQS